MLSPTVTRSTASLSLTFGLVSMPIRLYSATEISSAIKDQASLVRPPVGFLGGAPKGLPSYQ